MKSVGKVLLGALIGVFVTVIIQRQWVQTDGMDSSEQPLYWVAPMDPNFRKNEPGKSPMGMDLVPVYASEQAAGDNSPGEISISPVVVNNLGIKTAIARLASLNRKIKTLGIVQYDENKMVHIHPRVEGWIDKLHVKSMGDQVVKGELLYEIYSPELVNAQEEFVLALKRNNTALIKAAEARLKSLQIPDGIIAQVRKQKQSQQTIPFYSPQNGVVEHIEIREGFYVKPGTTVMSIAELSSVWVEAQVLNYNKPDLITGAKARMRLKSFPDQIWQGEVEYIYPALDMKTQTIRARLVFPNASRILKPNMFVDVEIDQPETEALLIPQSALIRFENSVRVVMKTGKGQYKSVVVTPGDSDAGDVQIKSGLLPGDEVVTSAQFLLDSESSKSSDFDRLSLSDMQNVASTFGVINAIDEQNRTLNISREAIEKWGRGPATLDFYVPEQVNMEQFKAGQKVHFYFRADSGVFSVLHAYEVIDGSLGS